MSSNWSAGQPTWENLLTPSPMRPTPSTTAKSSENKSTIRRLIDASTSILRDAYDESQEPKELVAQAEQRIFQIQDERNANSAAEISEVLQAAMARMNARMKGEQLADGVMTHFTDFDNMTGGLHSGELIILAARPSMGKTAFAMNIAEQVAMKDHAPVLFVSLEMSAIELADRLLCSVARVNGSRLRNGTISQEDRLRLVQVAGQISQAPLYVDDAPAARSAKSPPSRGASRNRNYAKPTGVPWD